jgi:hypothetical protein
MKETKNISKQAASTITPEQLVKEIRGRAKEIFDNRKGTKGDALSDWLEAEKQIKREHRLP